MKNLILETICNNKSLRKELSFKEHIKLYNYFSKLNEDEILDLYLYEGWFTKKKGKKGKPPIPKAKVIRVLQIGLVASAIALPKPFDLPLWGAVKYMYDNWNYECSLKCELKPGLDEEVCYRDCDYLSKKKVVDEIEKNLKKCLAHPIEKEKKRCAGKLWNVLTKWKKKLAEAEIRMKYQKRMYAYRLKK